MEGGREERSPQKVCYSAGDERGMEGGRKSTGSLPASLAGVFCVLAWGANLLGAGVKWGKKARNECSVGSTGDVGVWG